MGYVHVSDEYQVYVWAVCSQLMRAYRTSRDKNRHIVPVRTYNTRPIEIREIVISTHAGKTFEGLPRARERAQFAPGPRPTCPAGIFVSTTCRFAEKRSYKTYVRIKRTSHKLNYVLRISVGREHAANTSTKKGSVQGGLLRNVLYSPLFVGSCDVTRARSG